MLWVLVDGVTAIVGTTMDLRVSPGRNVTVKVAGMVKSP